MNAEESAIASPAQARQYAALMALTRGGLGLDGDERGAVQLVTATVAEALEVARVSLWRFDASRRMIVCQDLFDTGSGQHSAGAVLHDTVIPGYFRALAENDIIAADDARTDPRTAELADSYLEPLGITSMLDVPVLVAGRLDGVLCCEHIGEVRRWTHGEHSFATSVANLVALMLTQCARAQSEARLRSVVEHEPECVKIVDLGGNVLDMNPAGLRMVQAGSLSEVIGKQAVHLVHPDDRDAFLDLHERVVQGHTGQITFRACGLQGAELWLESHSTPLREGDGRITGVLSVTRDVTDQKRAERVMLNVARAVSLPIGDHFLDELTFNMVEVLAATGGALALTEPGDPRRLRTCSFVLRGQRMQDVCYEVTGTPCEGVVAGESWVIPHSVQERFPTDRMLVDYGLVAYVGVPLHNQQGDVIGLAAVFRDRPLAHPDLALSAMRIFASRAAAEICRQAASAELRAIQRRQELILDSAGEGILGMDTSGRVVFVNRAAREMLGQPEGALNGAPGLGLLVPRESGGRPYPEEESPIARTLRDGAIRRADHEEFLRADGTTFPAECVCSPMRGADGEVTGVVVSFRDISERRRMEQHLLRSQRMESIGTLAGGIAHDLNNVLAPILLAIGLLRTDEQDPSRLQLLSRIEGSAQRGAELIRQVLSFARGVQGKPGAVNAALLARDIERIVHDTFPKNLQFELSAPPDLWPVNADPTQLHQVLMNLCVNARDAMPGGGRLLLALENAVIDARQARLNPQAKAGRYVLLRVEDTGVGIPRELQDRIFEPFFTTKEIGKGTGLGLSTVLTIVRSHGGFITLQSDPGKGAKFMVYLPAIVARPAEPEAPIEVPGLPRGRGETILLVDDEAVIRDVAQRILEAFNYHVISASDGAEAVALFSTRRKEIAVVITDMAMPVMDGPATIATLRKIEPGVRIIGSSGLTSHAEVTSTQGLALDGFIAKPYTAETMLSVLAGVLHGARR